MGALNLNNVDYAAIIWGPTARGFKVSIGFIITDIKMSLKMEAIITSPQKYNSYTIPCVLIEYYK